MADYLSNLVSKSLGRSGEVQPRGLSLYEPLPGTATLAMNPGGDGGPAAAEVQAEGEWPGSEPTSQATAARPAAGPLPRRRDRSLAPGLEVAHPAGRRPESPAPEMSRGSQPAIAPPAADIGPWPRPYVPGDSEPAGPPAARDRKAEAREAVEPLVRERIVERIVVAEPEDRAGRGDPAPPGSRPHLPDRQRQPGTPGEPKPAPPAAPVVVQPQVHAAPPAATAAEPPVPRPAPAEAAPTIHVTIGRIEVRATPPEPATRRPRQAPPVMSLEEYLKQHTRGGSG